ncbi:hypothetical protein [Paenibacillus koleovorans]|uniref:hypothetical protein n=1 Tax=Paenibacillus koleovorans TaxID=121608 RepID=UPI000FD8090A|nr:hypothetical protein [Paenibacillus koleovorans]
MSFGFLARKVEENDMYGLPLAAKVDMKDVGEAMFFVMVVVITFIVLIMWTKMSKKKRMKK